MEPSIMLIPSPLLGPATWEATAQVLQRAGRRAPVPSLQCVSHSGPPYWPAGVDAVVRAAGREPVILVPHSNAGLYVPAALAELGRQVRGVVFVDAALPGAGYHASREFLAPLTGADGKLPPWTSWWEESDIAELFPDAEVRSRVEAEQQRMPVAYYDHLPPAPHGWDEGVHCAYIWFAEPYDAGAEQALASGWLTKRVPGQHLHMLIDPQAVAAAILELADARR
ncbi:MAG: alpha/beta hydrolase [Jatrophihabitans sp.]|uniref:alpha/beta hydrolase n=1 Tax=Jatrophihabitans sp. TaxID=1932789 RepID=UPI00390F2839